MASQPTVLARSTNSYSPMPPKKLLDLPRSTSALSTTSAVVERPSHAYDISAQSVQFVASPGQTCKLKSALPAKIREAFSEVAGYAGCVVMVSNQEARLITVVTLWNGRDRDHQCLQNADRLRNILAPHVDHWLRSDQHAAHLSLLPSSGDGPSQTLRTTEGSTTANHG